MHKNWAPETIHLPPGLLKYMEGTLYNSCAAILSFSKRRNVFLKMNHHIFPQYLILQTLMPWPAISISDITWALLPTQWAQRPMEIQTHSQYDIIRLNDRSPLLTLCRHAASPSYCLVFISSAFPGPAYDKHCSCVICFVESVPPAAEMTPLPDSEVTLAPLCKFVSFFALHKYTMWKTFHMTRLVPVCRLHADNCKCCPLRSIYSAVTHQPQSSGGQRASPRMWMSSQKRRLITCNDTGQLMALLEQLY